MKKLLALITIGLFFGASIASAVTLIGINSGMRIEGRRLTDLDFSLSYVVNPVVVTPGSVSTTTFKDQLFQINTTATIRNNATVNFSPTVGGGQSASFFSEDPTIATIDGTGNVAYVSNGSAKINVTSDWLTRQIPVAVSQTGGSSATILAGYVSGSLAKSASNAIDTLITGATTTALRLFSTEDDVNAVYVRNTSNWLTAAGVDTSCVAAWNSAEGVGGAGTLITPRHVIMAAHNSYGAGAVIRFIDANNNLYTGTVQSAGQVAGTDIWVAVLTSDVSSNIKPCQILPANYLTYLPTITATTTIPAIGLIGGGFASNQSLHGFTHPFKMTLVRDLRTIGNSSGIGGIQFQFPNTLSTTTRDAYFYDNIIGGDSGNPAFLLISGKLSLLTCWFSGNGGSGPSYPDNITAINSLIVSLGNSGGYSVSTTDLSGFNTY